MSSYYYSVDQMIVVSPQIEYIQHMFCLVFLRFIMIWVPDMQNCETSDKQATQYTDPNRYI